MIGAVVYKMTGSGNDFVFFDGRSAGLESWSPERIRAVCDRQRGLGADGFVILEPGSRKGAVRFHFFNNDGGRAAMCGNGALCATRMAAHIELADPAGMLLETDAGGFRSCCLDGPGERAQLVLGDITGLQSPKVKLARKEGEAHLLRVGVPHLVVSVADLAGLSLLERGRALRSDPALGAEGANVNFVSQINGKWAMRTYERGVEGETLACGTGAVAAACTLALLDQVRLPLVVLTASGGILEVSGEPQAGTTIRAATLTGEGRLVARAVLGDLSVGGA